MLMLAYGRGRWAVSQKRIMTQQSYSVVSTVVRDTQLFLNVYLDINSTNMSSSKELNLMLFCIAKRDKYL